MVHGIEDTKKRKNKTEKEKIKEQTKHLSEAGRLIGKGIGKSLKPKKKK